MLAAEVVGSVGASISGNKRFQLLAWVVADVRGAQLVMWTRPSCSSLESGSIARPIMSARRAHALSPRLRQSGWRQRVLQQQTLRCGLRCLRSC